MHIHDETSPLDGPDRRDDRGETIALVILWPALLLAILLLTVHAFIVGNARAEAEVAASEGLRAAWRWTTAEHPVEDRGFSMARAAEDGAARFAGAGAAWRWWRPDSAAVYSDWCFEPGTEQAPHPGSPGWILVVVTGEVQGPLAAIWPDRLDRVYATASGPAVLSGDFLAGTGPPAATGATFPDPTELLYELRGRPPC